jgi:hypothetical protein
MKKFYIMLLLVIPFFGYGAFFYKHESNTICEKPMKGWLRSDINKLPNLPSNTITLYDSKIKWNGATINYDQLSKLIYQVPKYYPVAFIIFDIKSKDCKKINAIRNLMEKNLKCSEGNCGEGAEWQR